MGSVRSRITLIAALATAVAVAVAGFLLITQLERSLRVELDASLERQVENFEFAVLDTQDFDSLVVPNDPETLLVIMDRSGGLLLANDLGVEGSEIVSQLPLDDVDWFETVQFADVSLTTPTQTTGVGDMRTAFYEIFLDDVGADTQLIALFAQSNDPIDRTVSRSRTGVLIGTPLLVAFVAGLAWWLTGRSLRPVDVMRREVDEISSTDLGRRVSEPSARDEVGELATTMNAMLARLEQSQNAQEQFVSDAAHELRTPLASIAAQLDVDAAHPASADVAATAHNVRREVARLQSLIDGLLASARGRNQPEVRPNKLVDLDVLAVQAVSRVARPPHVSIDQRGIGIGTVRGNSAALASVLDNLLANAYRHASTVVAVGVGTDQAGVWLTVDDDGDGIAEPDRERVFDRFVRLDEARTRDAGGSGLGLALARETAERHGGTLHVEASGLGGARFALRLPNAG